MELTDFIKGVWLTVLGAAATGIAWLIGKVVNMDSKFATKAELNSAVTALNEKFAGLEEDLKIISIQLAKISLVPESIARLEREIGSAETGVRGAVNRLRDEMIALLTAVKNK